MKAVFCHLFFPPLFYLAVGASFSFNNIVCLPIELLWLVIIMLWLTILFDQFTLLIEVFSLCWSLILHAFLNYSYSYSHRSTLLSWSLYGHYCVGQLSVFHLGELCWLVYIGIDYQTICIVKEECCGGCAGTIII